MALVIGANSGLGLEVSLGLAAHGVSRIIFGVRDPTKCDATKSILAKNPNIDVQVWQVEQESFASIKEFADQAAGLDRLDIVILNAGVKGTEYVKSSKEVNHPGTALLSLLLLGPLQRAGIATGAPARLTIVSSENHFWAKLKETKRHDTLAHVDDKETFGKAMDRGNVVINVVNPGFCRSSLHRNYPTGASFANMVGWTAAQGGHCLTDAATQQSISAIPDRDTIMLD
ncbi:hypothetical protein GGR54DRAFT_646525 [Hypoxylon sp. NC1633]|nr:hypothetical protein GGR54DRAFT_646525 [Hypoxylon sp. NC1633]